MNNDQNGDEDTLNNNQTSSDDLGTPGKSLIDRITGLPSLIGKNMLASMMGGWGDIINEGSSGKAGLKGIGHFLDTMGYDPTDNSSIENGIAQISRILPSFWAAGGSLPGALMSATGTVLGSNIGGRLGGETGEAIGGVLGNIGANALKHRPSSKTVDKYAREDFEKNKESRIKSLVRENEVAERSLRKEGNKLAQTEKKLSNQEPIKKVEKELTAYDKKITENYKKASPLYKEAEKHESTGKFSSKMIQKAAEHVNDSLGKGMSAEDATKLEKILKDLEITTNRTSKNPHGDLTIPDAKILKRNINNQIYDRKSSSVFRENAGKIVRPINDFIVKNNEPKHNSRWNKAEYLYKESAKLKADRAEFLLDKKQQIKEVTREHKIAESQNKAAIKEHASQFKATDAEHQKAIREIGKESYDTLLKDKIAQEKLSSNIEKIAKTANKYGSLAVGSILASIFPGGKIAGFALGTSITAGVKEYNRIRQAFNDHPNLYKKTIQLIKDSIKRDVPALISKVNKLGKEIEEAD